MTSYTATYSPEDNKLRLYASARLDAETFARIKAAGFKWAPRQELFVAPKWTPEREDLLTELAGEIEAEDMTLAERAAMKAERLDNLAARRNADANAFSRRADELSQAFYMGQPILVGHHSERKARKTQERMNGAQKKAGEASAAANYWLYRASGVERFANMKNDPRTRANRIKTLLAELRDLQRAINVAHRARKIWEKLDTDNLIRLALANSDSRSLMAGYGLYSAVESGEVTPAAARERCLANADRTINGPTRRRWIDHVLNRLAFERSMLGDVPRFTGDLTPVILQAFAREHGAEKPKASETDPGAFEIESPVPLPLHLASGCTLDLDADDWRDLMQSVGYIVPEAKPRRVSKKDGAAVPLINPTEEQAAQLQRIWHAHATARMAGRGYKFEPREPKAISQAVYSANAKGSYSQLSTIEIDADGREVRLGWERMERVRSGEPVARIRVWTGGMEMYGPKTVLRIADKPAKALPLDLDAIEAAALAALQPAEVAA